MNEVVRECVGQDPSTIYISQGVDEKRSNMEVVACVRMLESTPYASPYRNQRFEPLRKEDDLKPYSQSEAPNLELKPLLSTLRYTFLNSKSHFPVIVNSFIT